MKMVFIKTVLMAALLFSLSSCKLTIFTFSVADTAQTHQILKATITGEALYTGEATTSHGIVLQIPNEWYVLSAKSVDNTNSSYTLNRDTYYESKYTSESGYKVWAGVSTSSTNEENRTHTVTIELFTGTKSGNYNLKVSAAGLRNNSVVADDPANTFNFANIVDDRYVESVMLINKWDMKEDGKIGLEEAINALQVTAGLRNFCIRGFSWKADSSYHTDITVTNNSNYSVVSLIVVKKPGATIIDPNDSSTVYIGFFLYLTPYDVWKGRLRYNGSRACTEIYSDDNSCLVTVGKWASPVSPLAHCLYNNDPGYGEIDIYPRAATLTISDRDALYQAYPVDFQTPVNQYEPVSEGILSAGAIVSPNY